MEHKQIRTRAEGTGRHFQAQPRRRYHSHPGLAFWFDWAPIIALGLCAAFAGIWSIGSAVLPTHSGTPAVIEAQRPPQPTTLTEPESPRPATVTARRDLARPTLPARPKAHLNTTGRDLPS